MPKDQTDNVLHGMGLISLDCQDGPWRPRTGHSIDQTTLAGVFRVCPQFALSQRLTSWGSTWQPRHKLRVAFERVGSTLHVQYVSLDDYEPSRGFESVWSVARVRQDRNPTDQQSAHAFSRREQTGNPRAEPQAEPGVASYSCFFANTFALGWWWTTHPGGSRTARGRGSC